MTEKKQLSGIFRHYARKNLFYTQSCIQQLQRVYCLSQSTCVEY